MIYPGSKRPPLCHILMLACIFPWNPRFSAKCEDPCLFISGVLYFKQVEMCERCWLYRILPQSRPDQLGRLLHSFFYIWFVFAVESFALRNKLNIPASDIPPIISFFQFGPRPHVCGCLLFFLNKHSFSCAVWPFADFRALKPVLL